MIDPVRKIARNMALKKSVSTVPTRIIPMSKLRSVTILIDGMDPDIEDVKKEARKFFDEYGVEMNVVAPMKWDVNWYGIYKETITAPGGQPRTEDMFLSLIADPDNYAASFELRRSKASFKVARFQVPGNAADIVIYDPVTTIPRTPEAFAAIRDYLSKIE